MNFTSINADGLIIRGSSRRETAVAAVEAALRTRRNAHAAYGAALVRPDYATPQAERDAHYAELRAAIATAEATLVDALQTLEGLL